METRGKHMFIFIYNTVQGEGVQLLSLGSCCHLQSL